MGNASSGAFQKHEHVAWGFSRDSQQSVGHQATAIDSGESAAPRGVTLADAFPGFDGVREVARTPAATPPTPHYFTGRSTSSSRRLIARISFLDEARDALSASNNGPRSRRTRPLRATQPVVFVRDTAMALSKSFATSRDPATD